MTNPNIARLTVLITELISSRNKSLVPKELSELAGTIAPGKALAWFTIIVGISFALGGLLLVIIEGEWLIGLSCFLLFGCVAGFMMPSLFSIHDVSWNDKVVQGPSKMLGPTLGRKRTEIA